jgi:uncharacterized delta-60 repeat protein
MPSFCQTPDAFDPGVGGSLPEVVSLAVQADGKVLVGGSFGTLGGQPRSYIGRLYADGTLDQAFAPDAGNKVWALAVQTDGKILVGGEFGYLSGGWLHALGRLNADGTLDSGFAQAIGAYYYPNVYSVAVQADEKVLVGGYFETLSGQARPNFGRLTPSGALDTGFACLGVTWPVYSLALQADAKILAGGGPPLAGNYFMRRNSDGTLESGFNPGISGRVLTLAVQADGKVLVGGVFTTQSPQPCTNLARLNVDGTWDGDFNASGINGYVFSMAVQADGKILVGGSFTTSVTYPCTNLARLNTDGTVDFGFNISTDNRVYSLALQPDGKILVGGWIASLGGQPRSRLGRLNNTGPATQSLSCDGSTITWLRGGTSPEVWRTTFEQSTGTTTWTSLGAGTRIPGGWQLTGVSVPAGATIRARGHVAGGREGSGWFVESTLVVPMLYHAADCRDPRWVMDGTEVNRVLAYWRAGAYHVDAAGLDGYGAGTGSTNGPLHSADYHDPRWVIDGTEVNRVLSYWRAGGYHLDASGLDGYAPGTN